MKPDSRAASHPFLLHLLLSSASHALWSLLIWYVNEDWDLLPGVQGLADVSLHVCVYICVYIRYSSYLFLLPVMLLLSLDDI